MLTQALGGRVAIVGGGIGGLTCARALQQLGLEAVVFEAGDRLGGRCSTRLTPAGSFDDAAQLVGGNGNLAFSDTPLRNGLPSIRPWAVTIVPPQDEDEEETGRRIEFIGRVGAPSMQSLAEVIAGPIDLRLETPIMHTERRGSRWVLHSRDQSIDEDFTTLVLALPAPLAFPLAERSSLLSDRLAAVQYGSRWVLLVGTERRVGLPGYREFRGSPIERVAAMHTKPGRTEKGMQRWFVEADARWSDEHADDDSETVIDLLLSNFIAHAGADPRTGYLAAHRWKHAFASHPVGANQGGLCLWDAEAAIGVCGDSVAPSRLDLVSRSGIDLARAIAFGLADPFQDERLKRVPRAGFSPVRANVAPQPQAALRHPLASEATL